jgi:hypothetical protein
MQKYVIDTIKNYCCNSREYSSVFDHLLRSHSVNLHFLSNNILNLNKINFSS